MTAGILAVRDPALADRLYFLQNAEGSALGPFDCWLLVRGLKTMALRMERQAANAQRIAEWLAAHPLVQRVNYPGLASHPGKDVHDRQVGPGCWWWLALEAGVGACRGRGGGACPVGWRHPPPSSSHLLPPLPSLLPFLPCRPPARAASFRSSPATRA